VVPNYTIIAGSSCLTRAIGRYAAGTQASVLTPTNVKGRGRPLSSQDNLPLMLVRPSGLATI
jgi:hypothetical protein